MQNPSFISPESASKLTLVSVSGGADATGAGMALVLSQLHMPGCRAVLCSPMRPQGMPDSVEHVEIAPLSQTEHSWFMMFVLWTVVHTEFALIVQDNGWVLDGSLWRDEYFEYDYIGAPTHLAKVKSPDREYWSPDFQWANNIPLGCVATPVFNGDFSLRSRRLMRAFVDHPDLKICVPKPDYLSENPLKMCWKNDQLNESFQIAGELRPKLEGLGYKFCSLEIASNFSIGRAYEFHNGKDALGIFGHCSNIRKLIKLEPLTVDYSVSKKEIREIFGEEQLALMLERRGYKIQYKSETDDENINLKKNKRVYDCIIYNGEFDVLQIRLHELNEVVDFFVIVEATRTFFGFKKALSLDLESPEISQFRQRIRYIVVDDMPDDPPGSDIANVRLDWLNESPKTGFWLREQFQRNQITRGLYDAEPDDLIIAADADEIPRASVVAWMKQQPFESIYGLKLKLHYFFANYCNISGPESDQVWCFAANRKYFDQKTPDQLRKEMRWVNNKIIISDAGWHYSFLGMKEDKIRKKIGDFSHQEYNNKEFLDSIDLNEMIRSGKDLLGRNDFVWAPDSKSNAPKWLIEQENLKHLFLN